MPWRSAIAKKPTQRKKVVHKKIPWSEEELVRGKKRGLARNSESDEEGRRGCNSCGLMKQNTAR
jgi:hypothetical protein